MPLFLYITSEFADLRDLTGSAPDQHRSRPVTSEKALNSRGGSNASRRSLEVTDRQILRQKDNIDQIIRGRNAVFKR